ncbi:alanine racemase [Synechococcus sp. PROS-U-1]|uniref:alanine racemase n=1 Tax=Synechococcus sp. PROS-U-1 TaxID=1400866 RepID=UPI001645B602|nr:alanine racemase [Synechococcus sp. PROS-U-1]QNJ02084.1 alanine racemase [Synechococcus sp. PROS-U-1]
MIPELNPRQRAWVEVSPAAIRANARALCQHLGPRTLLMAVVKADGYGHGAETVARAALQGGASSLGVATLQEGLELRRAGLEAPVLLLSNLNEPDDLRTCLHWRLMPTLSSLKDAQLCNAVAADSGRRFDVQLKIDTGMARLGCSLSDSHQTATGMQRLKHLNLAGIYSHLACADEPDDALTSLQQDRFVSMLSAVPQAGDSITRHLANSAGTLLNRELHHDLVRVGLALYGHAPASHLSNVIPLQPALAVRARVSLIRTVPAGTGVSYGHRFITKRPSRLAVVGLGYADGVLRSLSGQIHALHRNRPLPQVGAITMDQLVLDATNAPELEEGNIVTLLGRDGDLEISPQDWSNCCGSIPWEILCGFKRRLPRVEI